MTKYLFYKHSILSIFRLFLKFSTQFACLSHQTLKASLLALLWSSLSWSLTVVFVNSMPRPFACWSTQFFPPFFSSSLSFLKRFSHWILWSTPLSMSSISWFLMRVGRLFFILLLISTYPFDHLRFSKVVFGLGNEWITPLGSRNL